MTIKLELNEEQQEILREILDNVLGDMSYEIADTDSSTYKAKLKERRDMLRAIASQLKD